MANLEAAEDSSSSQLRMCLTLRLKTVADCLTSPFSSITTAPTPATVSMKFVKPIIVFRFPRIRFEDRRPVGTLGILRGGFMVKSFLDREFVIRLFLWAVILQIYGPFKIIKSPNHQPIFFSFFVKSFSGPMVVF